MKVDELFTVKFSIHCLFPSHYLFNPHLGKNYEKEVDRTLGICHLVGEWHEHG